jgi:hypothetical protein
MTVAELAKKLEGLDPKMYVAVIHERDGESDFLDVDHVAPGVGTSFRNDAGKPGFRFDKDGLVKGLFITAVEG